MTVELAGRHEMAQILGVSYGRIDQLRKTDPTFPQPYARLSAGPIWLAADIEAYAAKRREQTRTGRGVTNRG